MTDNTLRALVEKWRAERSRSYPSDSCTQSGYDSALKSCADELEAELHALAGWGKEGERLTDEMVERAIKAFWPPYYERQRKGGARQPGCFAAGMRAALSAALSREGNHGNL